MRSRRGEEALPRERAPEKKIHELENILDSVISQHKIGKRDLLKKSLPQNIVNKYFKHIPPFCWKQMRGLVGKGGEGCVPGRATLLTFNNMKGSPPAVFHKVVYPHLYQMNIKLHSSLKISVLVEAI